VDFQKAADRLARLQALKALGGGLLKDEIASWRETSTRRGAIEIEKKAAQAKLRSHMDTTISPRQKKINTLLEMFGASFRLVETKASFVGREASTDFSIAIGPFSIKAGEASATEPSFATVLSGGDKFTLALAHFLLVRLGLMLLYLMPRSCSMIRSAAKICKGSGKPQVRSGCCPKALAKLSSCLMIQGFWR
jgi:hypothetical protein